MREAYLFLGIFINQMTFPLNDYFYDEVPCGFSNPLVSYSSFISTVMS